ncbi:Glu/Leu/Phe/Val dehydrogenase dimerization domain-containing protein [Enhygromyxa salina]|uniref:Leucine dehydrogenase n=1 Tax=Enhygromyxa salina TaxID=215803 RepID=A0A2S9YQX6_9BACT|nr:Glu/Leu/Phe/Val dehydrogenase dimerization domain-containing protein [Enhygromyxa salina]PRQ07462.1 Leucine dehydrogenase [Enhygromyxa salina]
MTGAATLFAGDQPGGDWERIIAVQHAGSGLRAIVVLHSLARGPAFGGVRRVAYASEQAGLADAKRLAASMSLKCALAGLPAGGGKTVIFDAPTLDRQAAYTALGEVIQELGGVYVCGPDIGTGKPELAALRRATSWVNPVGNDAGRSTAVGVLAGLRGLLGVVFDDPSPSGRRCVIEGLGGVGLALATSLLEAGASVAGWDPDPGARARAAALGVELLEKGTLAMEPCDVFMPCALGHTLTRERCERAPWRAVCGSANNQLADRDAAAALRAREIAWAPDFVVNAGAVIEGVETTIGSGGGAAHERVVRGIEAIEGRCAQLLTRARAERRCVSELALEVARAALRAPVDLPPEPPEG